MKWMQERFGVWRLLQLPEKATKSYKQENNLSGHQFVLLFVRLGCFFWKLKKASDTETFLHTIS